jgi:microcystin-dependent protein
MSDPFIGEVRMFAGNFAPRGWEFCDGRLLPISSYTALFSLLGTTYGGNGASTFALPDLRGRIPVHMGASHVIGELGGNESVTLTVAQMPPHRHPLAANVPPSSGSAPGHGFGAPSDSKLYAPVDGVDPLGGNRAVGGSGPHENMMPFLAVSFIIALEGIYPSRN